MSRHMSIEEFRDNARAVVDWLADYMASVQRYPVLSPASPGATSAKLPQQAPELGEAFSALLADLERVVIPGTSHWQSPNWFAYFPANTSPPSILAEFVTAGLGLQGMLWSTSPACTEIESTVLDWLVDLLGLPQPWKCSGPGGGVIQMSASDASLTALVVARHGRRAEAHAEDMVVYASTQAHSSIEKGCTVAGIGHCRKVDVGADFAMRPESLQVAIEQDLAEGLLPLLVVSAVGTTATTAIDPIPDIVRIARRYRLWHHVDAAYAGTAMICEEFRRYQPELDAVDSYTFNPHKWMMVNFDCNVFWVADRQPLLRTMSITPAYLKDQASDAGQVIDYRDWHVPLGRRFRALKLWWVIRSYGASGIRAMVRRHVGLAAELANWLSADLRFELIAPHPFGLVCFRHVDGNQATRTLAAALNQSGKVSVTPSEIDGQCFIRVSIGQTYTAAEHVRSLWCLIKELA